MNARISAKHNNFFSTFFPFFLFLHNHSFYYYYYLCWYMFTTGSNTNGYDGYYGLMRENKAKDWWNSVHNCYRNTEVRLEYSQIHSITLRSLFFFHIKAKKKAFFMQFILANLKYKFSAICCSIFQQKKKILKCFSNFNNYFRFFSFSFSLRYYFYPSFFPGTYLKFAFETRRKTSQPVLQQKSLLAQKKLWLAYCFISFCFCSYFCQHQNH